MKDILNNDKALVIVAVFLLAIASMFTLGASAGEIVKMTITGLFGVVVGQSLAQSDNNKPS
ncbi:MAG TPA: hypothetical protein VF790_11720 [Dissulfurispiraceae bacterium]